MASAKHFMNDPGKLVSQALRSITLLNPSVSVDEVNKVVYRNHYDDDDTSSPCKNVSILSGGGAGHEPSFVSFVGQGMLDVAVSGTIFASPSPSQIYAALRDLERRRKGGKGGKGGAEPHSVVMVLMNYTGDVMNFGLAAEKAQAKGMRVDMVVVRDDVGVGREKGGKVGRRGIAGTVLVLKIAGAMAEEGCGHEEIKRMAELATENLVSIGASLDHVHVPGHDDDSDETLGKDEIEIGMGIHNEQGSKRMRIPDTTSLIKHLLGQLLDETDKDRAFLGKVNKSDEFVLMVNNLGGVSPLELGGITMEVVDQLESEHGIKPKRVYSGTFMTSLNGNGVSVSLLRIADGKMLGYLDAETRTLGAPGSMHFRDWHQERKTEAVSEETSKEDVEYNKSGLKLDLKLFVDVLTTGLKNLISAEKEITKYDSIVGDGDCGIGLKRGAEAVLELLQSGDLDEDAAITMQKVAEAVERSMDGTSGAIYCIFFNAFSAGLRNCAQSSSSGRPVTMKDWYTAALSAQKSLSKYTPARPGDRTLMDALFPFLETLRDTEGDLRKAVEAAKRGVESTRGMKASLGRTVYVGDVGDVPDPGAVGVAKLVEGIEEGVGRGMEVAN